MRFYTDLTFPPIRSSTCHTQNNEINPTGSMQWHMYQWAKKHARPRLEKEWKRQKTTQLVWHTCTAFRENALTCVLVSVEAKTRALAWRTKAWKTIHTITNLCVTLLASCFCLYRDLHYTVMSVLTLLQVGAWHIKHGELKSIFNSNINTLKQSNIFDIRANCKSYWKIERSNEAHYLYSGIVEVNNY